MAAEAPAPSRRSNRDAAPARIRTVTPAEARDLVAAELQAETPASVAAVAVTTESIPTVREAVATASIPTIRPAAPSATDIDDAFAAAARLLGTSAPQIPTIEDITGEKRENAASLPEAATAFHKVPRRRSGFRRGAAFTATVGAMGIAGLMAVAMTVPTQAIAVAQDGSHATTSLVAADDAAAAASLSNTDIQAFVASSDVQNESMVRDGGYETISMAQVAAEDGIQFSNSLYTNDPNAAIQWPYIVGVAMSSGYGPRWGTMHQGIDLVPGAGAPIQAIADGTVRIATEAGGGYGVTAYVDHVIDGQVVTSHYSHMQYGSLRVKAGDTIKVGDIIGLTGNTGHSFGAHLHFEIIINGATIDPLPWMQENAGRYEY